MRAAVAMAFVMLAASHPPVAHATAPAAWVCTLSEDLTRLVCIADADPLEVDAAAAVPPTATVNGTRFPLDPRRVWQVEMWSPPTEPEFVLQLARATVCYRSPGCSVTMAGASWNAIAPRETQIARGSRRP